MNFELFIASRISSSKLNKNYYSGPIINICTLTICVSLMAIIITVCAGTGLMLGGQVGAWISEKIEGVWILRLLLVVVLMLGIQLLLQGFQINLF